MFLKVSGVSPREVQLSDGKRRGAWWVSDRREVLGSALALGLTLGSMGRRAEAAEDDPAHLHPQIGDVLVHFKGEKKGEIIVPEDLPLGGPSALAWAKDDAAGVVREASNLNQLVLVRFEPEEIAEEFREHAAEGVVAYSAACTHQGCPVSFWKKKQQRLYCSCHGSQFDPKDGAKRVAGPAKRRLAMLPLKMEDGTLKVAGEFIGELGPRTKA
ncbi:MAG: Rieske (2Fe-2S) protein [Alphaproteobacteria bacterium]